MKHLIHPLLPLAGMALFPGTAEAKSPERPNILWIVSEDNTLFLGCYGDRQATTPNIDRMASEGILYENAFCTAPVSAPTRSTLLTGMYAPSIGSHQMRSRNRLPNFLRFYTETMQEAGYYCCNGPKEDYNTSSDYTNAWNGSGNKTDRSKRGADQPFFQIINTTITHESSLFTPKETLLHDPSKMEVPPYLPDLPEVRGDRALYFDRMTEMDAFVGEQLKRLEEEGLAENTIVFYYGDNGGVLGRSKRFCYDNGTHVPLIIRFPAKFQHLAPAPAGSRVDRLVSFVDFPITMLNLLDLPIPSYLQGQPFLGKNNEQSQREYAYMHRDRMDERYDLVRAIRNKQFRYIRNYMPHRPNGVHLNFLWQAKAMQAWDMAYRKGLCNETQSLFFQPKPSEELYDLFADPHEVNNLASNPQYKEVLNQMREANHDWIMKYYDTGFIPEHELLSRTTNSPYDFIRSSEIDFKRIVETADMASAKRSSDYPEIIKRLADKEATVRYWAAIGCINQPPKDDKSVKTLQRMGETDTSPTVRIMAAEALHLSGNTPLALKILEQIIKENDNEFVRLLAFNTIDAIGTKAEALKQLACTLYPEKLEKANGYDARFIIHWRSRAPLRE